MERLIRNLFCLATGGLLFVWLVGCSDSRDPGLLATYSGGNVLTVADLDAYLLQLPESARNLPGGELAAEFMEAHIRRLALQRVLADTAQADQVPFDVDGQAQWHRAVALAGLVTNEIGAAAAPDAETLRQKIEFLQPSLAPEPVMNFQHVFFRLDRSLTPEDAEAVRLRANSVAEAANAGSDFTELVREHSDSAAAESGGFVMNVRPSDLDESAADVLLGLSEGQVSEILESRTGLHLFRLIRRLDPPGQAPGQLEANARNILLRERFEASREALLARLREERDYQTDTFPWQIGEFSLSEAVLKRWVADPANEHARGQIIDQFLLANEAIDRGLEPDGLVEQATARAELERLDALFNQARDAFDRNIGEEDLRRYHAANAERFVSPQKVDLDLIFVPQGNDSFATQQRLEGMVERLRSGADFSALAAEHSEGPGADQGGHLGLLTRVDLSRLGPVIQSAVDNLETGVISDPIYCTGRVLSHDPWMLKGGFAVLRVRDRVRERALGFEEAVDQIRRAYAFENREALDKAIESQFLADAGFELLRTPELSEFQ